MTRRRRISGEMSMSLGFIADQEQRVTKQRQLIADLKNRGRPTGQAEAILKRHEEALTTLRNHADIMQELMSPTAYERFK
jgi:hypothetical protein